MSIWRLRKAHRSLLAFAAVAALIFTACSNSNDNAQSQATMSPTLVPANPSELSSLVWRFYHDQAQSTNKATADSAKKDIMTIVSQPFLKTHASTLVRDYGYIADPDVSITGVRGNAVDYTVTYDYISTNGMKLHWRRSGTWVAAHGAAGWQLNEDKWNNIHIVAVTYPNGTSYDVHDRVYTDGRHVFDVPGFEVTFTPTKDNWRTSVVSLATPTPEPVAATQPPVDPYASNSSGASHPGPWDDCDDDSIQTVGDDGTILEMLSGAVYRVEGYDTATSSVWLSTDDVLICGDRIVDKDENGEAVDAHRVR